MRTEYRFPVNESDLKAAFMADRERAHDEGFDEVEKRQSLNLSRLEKAIDKALRENEYVNIFVVVSAK